MEKYKLFDAELKFMNIIWEEEPIKSGELVRVCNEKLGWKKSTTYTVLRKLAQRGVLKNENTVVTSIVKREDTQIYESHEVVEKSFGGSLPKFLTAFFGNKKIQSYNIAYCQEAINKWKEQYSTYKALKCYTSAVFDYAKKMNLIKENPMKEVTFSKGERKQKKTKLKYFEKEELQDFLECCQKDKFPITYSLFRVLAFTGIRKGEALALTWDDVDFFNKTLEINKTITRNSDNKFISTPPKTNTSIRKISLDDETLNILKAWKTQQKRYLLAHGQHAKTKNQIIFSSKNNNYIDITRPNIILSRICKEHNFNDITIHGFRHTHCSLLFEAGLSIKEVQERLGHSDIHTTMNIYTHVTKKQKERSADKFAAYLNF